MFQGVAYNARDVPDSLVRELERRRSEHSYMNDITETELDTSSARLSGNQVRAVITLAQLLARQILHSSLRN